MPDPDCAPLTLRLPARAAAWWELAPLKAWFPAGARPVGYAARAGEFGFLAVRDAAALRSVVVLEAAAVAFDLPLCQGKLAWKLEGRAEVVPVPLQGGALLHVIAPSAPLEKLENLDLAGVRLGGRAILFSTETSLARGAVSYLVKGSGLMRHLVTGLAPGNWQIWWNGWLEDPGRAVEPGAVSLEFEGEAGKYFLRRL